MPNFTVEAAAWHSQYALTITKLVSHYGSYRKVAKALGIGHYTIRTRLQRPYSIKIEHVFAANHLLSLIEKAEEEDNQDVPTPTAQEN